MYVNEDLKVRTVNLDTGVLSPKDSILVVNAGVVNRVTSQQIFDSHLKSFVKATGSATTSLGLVVGSTGYKRIAFNTELFDENNDYNTSSYEFVAPKDGIYSVYVQYESSSLLAATSVGVAIFTDRSGTVAIEAEEVYTNVAFATFFVSPPTRKTQTLVKLNAGDKVFFGASSSLIVTSIGGVKSFFTIAQIK
ncbi:hypothetical protein HNQ02_003672 [Flavobacterium sp. 7E]|uniref:C1q-like domain-containing protein n=1 Tax=Flavobacterium sp. 7E TaxID=2735898 RepID=UPI0015707D4D|nr:hypothetical protein [Flavobacterium sp. 7E]NRS90725.1 hypothetical protein [Flavobacterium sp. 7E]